MALAGAARVALLLAAPTGADEHIEMVSDNVLVFSLHHALSCFS